MHIATLEPSLFADAECSRLVIGIKHRVSELEGSVPPAAQVFLSLGYRSPVQQYLQQFVHSSTSLDSHEFHRNGARLHCCNTDLLQIALFQKCGMRFGYRV